MLKKSILFIAFVTLVTACRKQIAIDLPNTKLATGIVFSNTATATGAVYGMYAQMGNLPFQLHITSGLASDEFFTNARDVTSVDMYTNALLASDAGGGDILGFWQTYQYVFMANQIMENLPMSTTLPLKVKQQLMGEAEFMRAYTYFNLVQWFGDVPLVTNTNYKVNTRLSRTPKDQVYQQMVQDLIAAQKDLNSQYVDVSDTAISSERLRPTVWAADALLARVYLYMGAGNYDKAEEQATAVINNTALYSLLPDLNAVFKMNSGEAIWQIGTYYGSSGPYFTVDGSSFVLTAPPYTGGDAGTATISMQLLNAFEPGDQRKVKWIGIYTDGTNSWNYPAKYKDNANTAATTSEFTMILRLAEQYLIRAEARAQQGNITGSDGAVADLNAIRHRAGLGDYTGAMDQTSVIAAISHERQVELFAEGDRWFNLKRTSTIDSVMGIVTPQKSGASWNSYQQYYPIWPSDLLADPNLVQTKGY